ncbi:hypothetical protein SPBR_08623 [Sporothrix brasiliensis 5110]|uniref:Uncharacterized protein n=1 Tax=Sporothrix brasiliensis 5110 TaxID=1398154 RepID=A0A0C2IHL7_9PEZI|nr:uncharacterized protein SPBR_08623 [Sporothrix brasiliensis 5110]KIH86505.1 hypothetical protein SPBR_08623 [Sporothrix brasiliensis 5110]
MNDDEAPAPDVLFAGVDNVFECLVHLDKNQDVLVVGDVSPTNFRAIETERNRRGQKFRLFYQPAWELVVVTVPTLVHSIMHTMLYDTVRDALRGMNAHAGWMSVGTTTFNATNGSSGQADAAGWPIDSRNADDWPTLVVEAGVSQTLRLSLLQAKMRWWFDVATSNHQVKVVVLVMLDAAREAICIEKWVKTQKPGRPGATTTRQATCSGLAAPQPVCAQTIDITWAGPAPIMQMPKQDRAPAHFCVTGGPLVIGFGEIYLRVPNTEEHDIAIATAHLQQYASRLWQYVV